MKARELLLLSLSGIAMALVTLPYIALVATVLINGLSPLIKLGLHFLIAPPPLPGGGVGGVGPVLAGTLLMAGMGAAIALSISLPTALYLSFYEQRPLARLVRILVEAMVEFPTIIIGLACFAVFSLYLGLGLNVFVASVALAIIMIPYTTLQATEALRIPKALLAEAGYALGLREGQVLRLVLSAARPGVVTAVLIGVSKIMGETAALLFTTSTSFNVFPTGPFSPSSGLPVLVFFYAFSPYTNWHEVAWGASLVLLLLVLSAYIPARSIARRSKW
jgi:phosphate transport system permease protein